MGQAATNLKRGWHVDPLQSTAYQPARKRKHEEVETEVVTEDLEGDTPFCEGSTGDGGCRKETERGESVKTEEKKRENEREEESENEDDDITITGVAFG